MWWLVNSVANTESNSVQPRAISTTLVQAICETWLVRHYLILLLIVQILLMVNNHSHEKMVRPERCNISAIRKVTWSATGLFSGLIPLKREADFRAARPVMTPWPRRRFTGCVTLCPRMPNFATPPKNNKVGIYPAVLGKDCKFYIPISVISLQYPQARLGTGKDGSCHSPSW